MIISGYTVTRDCIAGDYCVEACVRSLSAVCDEVVVVDAMSTDGTRELVASIPKVRIVDYPRHLTEVFDDPTFLTRWMNYGRERLHGDVQLYLDADEVIDADDVAATRAQAKSKLRYWCHRLNFWGDHRHVVPAGVVCGNMVVRLGPTVYWMPSDEGHVPETPIRIGALKWGPTIWHYGFIRHHEGFLRKSEYFQQALCGSFDDRLKRAKTTGEDWRVLAPCPRTPEPYDGHHPRVAHEWLKARGYEP